LRLGNLQRGCFGLLGGTGSFCFFGRRMGLWLCGKDVVGVIDGLDCDTPLRFLFLD